MSPRLPDPETRDRLLDAAERAFLDHGYAGASLQQICSEAGLSKGALFHLFPSKEALALAAVERFADRRLEAMGAAAAMAGADPAARVIGLVAAIQGRVDADFLRDNCLLGMLAQEVALAAPALSAQVHARFARWAGWLAQDLAAAKPPGADWSPEEVARHIIATFEGGLLLARATGDPGALRASLGHLRAWLATLLALPPESSPRGAP